MLARSGPRRTAGLAVVLGVLLVVALASLTIGAKTIPAGAVLDALVHRDQSESAVIVNDLRLPRTLHGIAAGVALGLAGALIQALTRNPLADPGILGVSPGAGFALVIAVGVLHLESVYAYIWFAFLGAILAALVVYALGSMGRGGGTPVRLTLAGVAFGAVLNGIGAAITLLDAEAFDRLRFWRVGSLAGRPLDVFVQLAPFLVVGVVIALLLTRQLNAVALGDAMAGSLGVHVMRTRVWGVVAVTLLCGGATAAVGPILFVGLMVPHVVRWVVGPDQRWILPYTCVVAPILVLVADIVGRVVVPPSELQVSIVTALIGAPVLIALVRRRRVSEL